MKEILNGGISVISLQFARIGEMVADGIKNSKRINESIEIQFIPRKSL
jgi:hypothetical protein